MLNLLGGIIGSFFSNLAKTILSFFVVQKLGQDEQVITDEKQANVEIQKDSQVRANVVPLTVASLQDIKPGTDPDFRD